MNIIKSEAAQAVAALNKSPVRYRPVALNSHARRVFVKAATDLLFSHIRAFNYEVDLRSYSRKGVGFHERAFAISELNPFCELLTLGEKLGVLDGSLKSFYLMLHRIAYNLGTTMEWVPVFNESGRLVGLAASPWIDDKISTIALVKRSGVVGIFKSADLHKHLRSPRLNYAA